MAPPQPQDLKAAAPPPLAPGTLGPRVQEAGGPRLVPAAHTPPLRRRAAAKERRKPPADDVAQALLLAPHAPCALCSSSIGQTQGLQGRGERGGSPLGLALIARKTCLGLPAPTLSGVGLLVGVSWAGGPGALLPTVGLVRPGEKDPRSPQGADCQTFHGLRVMLLRRCYP
jgi:hypothetical protein